jgi:cell division protein FtsZ
LSNNILKQAIKGIADIIAKPGLINVDFADIKTIMKDMGMAVMGTGSASGQDRSRVAALQAINSPLLENANITGAKGVLINVAGNKDLQLQEISDAATMIYEMVSEDANIILGSVIDDSLQDEIVVTVIATGCQTVPALATSEKTKTKQIQTNEEKSVESLKSEAMILTTDHEINIQDSTKNMIKMIDDVTLENTDSKVTLNQVDALEESPKIEHDSITLRHDDELVQANEEVLLTSTESNDASLDPDDLDTPTFMRKKPPHKGDHKEF